MIRATIYLKTGQVVTVYVSEITATSFTSESYTQLSWTDYRKDLPSLFRIDISQIVAITTEEIKDKNEYIRG